MKNAGEKFDIIIVGAGVPGAALALLLAKLEMKIALIDATPPGINSGGDSRTSALMQGSINILRETGAWEFCAVHGGPMKGLSIIDESKGGQDPLRVDFSASGIGQDVFAVNMPNHILRDTLLQHVKKKKLASFYAPEHLKSLSYDDFGVTAGLESGMTLRAPLIVGADGRQSSVRRLCGITHHEHDYGQTAITCLIDHTKPHNDISVEFHRPGGPFTLVPLPNNKSSIVWVEYNEDAEQFIRMPKSAFEQALQDRTRHLLGAVTLESPLQSWPLKHLRAKKMTAPRTALIAEAAHVLHPLGAQGLNLSLRDAATLAEVIADTIRTGLDIGTQNCLSAFEKRRHQDVMFRINATDILNRAVSTSSPAAGFLRRTGLNALNHFESLRDLVVREGMSPKDQQSRLMNGRAL